jgi:prefoldin alpha subunit
MKDKTSKITEFESFVNEKLRNDLRVVLDEQDKIYTDVAEYLQIKDTIEKITQAKALRVGGSGNEAAKFKLNTRIDLGCNFYSNAVVEDPDKIFIAIGYGFFLEMKFDEALRFIEKKVRLLNHSADDLTQKACEIKAQIKFVLEGIREMQDINFSDKSEKHSLYI